MLTITIDLARTRLMLVGEGAAALRRLRLIEAAGPADLEIYSPNAGPELIEAGSCSTGLLRSF